MMSSRAKTVEENVMAVLETRRDLDEIGRRQALEELAREIVPANYRAPEPPPLFPGQPVSWANTIR